MRHTYYGPFFSALLLIFALSAASPAQAASPAPGGSTRITSERMQYDAAGQRVIFEGKVHVTRPDFQLWSEKLTVVLEKENKAGNSGKRQGNGTAQPTLGGMEAGQVERIIAERNVRMQQGDKSGTCGKATYIAADGRIIMEQNPVVNDGPNQISGQVINYYTRDNRSEVIGGVDVRFTTDDKDDKGRTTLTNPNPKNEQQPAHTKGLKLGTGKR